MNLDLELIYNEVCDFTGFKIEKRSRKREYIHSRFFFFFLAKKNTNLSLKAIGKYLGDRNHATVLNSLNNLGKYSQDRGFPRKFTEITRLVDSLFSAGIYMSNTAYIESVEKDEIYERRIKELAKEKLSIQSQYEKLNNIVSSEVPKELALLITQMTIEEQKECIEYRIKPFFKMLKSRRTYQSEGKLTQSA